MPGQSSDSDTKITLFEGCGPLRTWSVIVTIMGDLLRAPGDSIGGRQLAALVGRMGISEQALRVAIHRLKKDGWIESRRTGRESSHFLTESARQETEAVRALIYDAEAPVSGRARLVIAPSNLQKPLSACLPAGSTVLSSRSALTTGADLAPDLFCVDVGQANLPDWVRDLLLPPALVEETEALLGHVEKVGEVTPRPGLDALVTRLLILHHWRRLVLRYSPLAFHLLPGDWIGARARAEVFDALGRYPALPLSQVRDLVG